MNICPIVLIQGKTKGQGRKRTFSRHEIEALQDGEELYEAMECDPAVEVKLPTHPLTESNNKAESNKTSV